MNTEKYYTASGTIPPAGPGFMFAFGIPTALIGGVIYGYAVAFIPLIYLNGLLTIAYGALVGYAAGAGAKKGKIRNDMAAIIFGALMGFFALYIAWAAWVCAYTDGGLCTLSPSKLAGAADVFLQSGVWSIKGLRPTGIMLGIIWLIEGLIIIGAAALLSLTVILEPFCERCDEWTEGLVEIKPLEFITRPEEFKTHLENGDLQPLMDLPKISPDEKVYIQANLNYCTTCTQLRLLTVKSVVITEDKDGNETTTEKDLLENLIISSEDFETLKNHWTEA